jgi:hypothetical protein
MKLTEIGNSPQRNMHCWNAITAAVDDWRPRVEVDGARLESRFGDDPTVLQFVLVIPGMNPCSAEFDISWIAYADQAERLEILTKMALVDIDLALLAQHNVAPA